MAISSSHMGRWRLSGFHLPIWEDDSIFTFYHLFVPYFHEYCEYIVFRSTSNGFQHGISVKVATQASSFTSAPFTVIREFSNLGKFTISVGTPWWFQGSSGFQLGLQLLLFVSRINTVSKQEISRWISPNL